MALNRGGKNHFCGYRPVLEQFGILWSELQTGPIFYPVPLKQNRARRCLCLGTQK